jgi:alpha-beta hydrolase superfamily lysophospholipase
MMKFLDRPDTDLGPQKLAYDQQSGQGCGVVFCGGFRSDMSGTKALVLIAPAIDMTERLMWARFSDKARAKLMDEGLIYDPSQYDPEGYPITKALIEDGRTHLMLDSPIDINVPVRILHGQQDDAVPWQLSLELSDQLATPDVELHLMKNGDHRLSEPHEIARLIELIEALDV